MMNSNLNHADNAFPVLQGTTEIADHAFEGREDLETVILPDSVARIGDRAFEGCKSLASIVIPEGVTSIGEDAFEDVPHIIYNGAAQSENNWGAKRWSRE